jgi:arylsulfatase A-like enzyme
MLPAQPCPMKSNLHKHALGALAVLLLNSCTDQEQADPGSTGSLPKRPNVILISIDTLRADHLQAYGYGRENSPFLKAFAEESYLFEQAYSHSNSTGPSHMTIFSGVLPETHLIDHSATMSLSPGVPFLPEILDNMGYRTAGFADGGYVNEAMGFGRGFDHFESRYEGFSTKLDRVDSWIADGSDQPNFLFLHTYGVHSPYTPLPEFDIYSGTYKGRLRERLDDLLVKKQAMLEGDRESVLGLAKMQRLFWRGKAGFGPEEIQYLVDLYDGCILEIDSGFNRLMGTLEQQGWLENSWIVVLSDHGEAFNEHGAYSHRKLYNEELHVPLIIRPPGGLQEGVRIPETVALIDVARTILSAIDAPAPDGMQGTPLLPALPLESSEVYSTAAETRSHHSLIVEGHKLVMIYGDAKEIYDREADSEEANNLIDDEELQPRIEAMTQRIDEIAVGAQELMKTLGSPVPAGELTPEQLSELEALGYIGGDDD